MKLADIKLEKVKIIVEILAFLSVASYFLYKNAAGWTGMTMSLDVVTNRVHDPNDKTKDILGVIVKVKNGLNNGTIRLSDAVAAIKYDNVTLEKGLEGIVRYEIENGKVIPGKQSREKPWTGLGPNEEILLSTYATVSKGSVCIVDVAVSAKKFLNTRCNESRSTAISLPIE
jgi:hypothetical protein